MREGCDVMRITNVQIKSEVRTNLYYPLLTTLSVNTGTLRALEMAFQSLPESSKSL